MNEQPLPFPFCLYPFDINRAHIVHNVMNNMHTCSMINSPSPIEALSLYPHTGGSRRLLRVADARAQNTKRSPAMRALPQADLECRTPALPCPRCSAAAPDNGCDSHRSPRVFSAENRCDAPRPSQQKPARKGLHHQRWQKQFLSNWQRKFLPNVLPCPG